jgi:inhibitor of KinA sporulation pathway (predicted exonuclease)
MSNPATMVSLKASFLVLQAELERLVDAVDFTADDGADFIADVWEQVQRDLVRKRPGLDTSLIADATSLKHAVHLCAIYRLYALSEIESDKVEMNRWLTAYQRELSEVKLDSSYAEGEGTMLVRG